MSTATAKTPPKSDAATPRQLALLSFFGESAKTWREATARLDELLAQESNRRKYQVSLARKYVLKMPPSVQGSHGSDATYAAACCLCIDFNLSEEDAWLLLREYNQALCSPMWPEEGKGQTLRRKLAEALKARARAGAGVVGSKGLKYTPRAAGGRGSSVRQLRGKNRVSRTLVNRDFPVRPAPAAGEMAGGIGVELSVSLDELGGMDGDFSVEAPGEGAGFEPDFAENEPAEGEFSAEKSPESPEKVADSSEKIGNSAEKTPESLKNACDWAGILALEPGKRWEILRNAPGRGLDFPVLRDIFRSPKVFFRLFLWKNRRFLKEEKRFASTLFLDARVAAELSVLFPSHNPGVVIRPSDEAGCMRLAVIEEDNELRRLALALPPLDVPKASAENPAKRESREGTRQLPSSYTPARTHIRKG